MTGLLIDNFAGDSEMTKQQRVAMIAAEASTTAAAELLRFAREGAGGTSPFDLEDPVAQLVEGLRLTIAIEAEHLQQQPEGEEGLCLLHQMEAALVKWQIDAGAV